VTLCVALGAGCSSDRAQFGVPAGIGGGLAGNSGTLNGTGGASAAGGNSAPTGMGGLGGAGGTMPEVGSGGAAPTGGGMALGGTGGVGTLRLPVVRAKSRHRILALSSRLRPCCP